MMFKRFCAGLVLALFGFSAHAGIVINNFGMFWDNPDTIRENGGTATVLYDLSNNYTWDKSFQVNIAPFTDTLLASGNGIMNWITPLAGSGIEFDPLDLISITYTGTVRNNYNTEKGMAKLSFDGSGLFFVELNRFSGLEITKIDAPVSAVPAPPSLILLATGLLGLVGTRRKKSGITIIRHMYQVEKPSWCNDKISPLKVGNFLKN